MILYHYTSYLSGQKIVQSQKILISKQADAEDDAVFGSGVYFTALAPPPANSLETLEKNNWGAGNAGDRLQYVIAVDFPNGKEMKIQSQKERDIYVHREEVNLTKYRYTHEKVAQNDFCTLC